MSKNDKFFGGQVAVVTGASTGTGLGLSRRLLESGAEVYMSSRTPAHIAPAAESLGHYREGVHAQVPDVRKEKAVAQYMDYVAERGRVDYLFCNAGVGFGLPLEVTTRQGWNTIFDVNVFGVVNCIGIDQAGAEILEGIRNGQGVIPLNEDARVLYRAIRASDYATWRA